MHFLINVTIQLNISSALKFCSATQMSKKYGSIFKQKFQMESILFQFYYINTLAYTKFHFMRRLKESNPLLQLYFKLQI